MFYQMSFNQQIRGLRTDHVNTGPQDHAAWSYCYRNRIIYS